MERLHQCTDLSQRLERELALLHASVVTQGTSQQVLARIARVLGISPSVTNLFVLPGPLTIPSYLELVQQRVAEFAPVDLQTTLDQAEAALFESDSPKPPSFEALSTQLSQWQRDNGPVGTHSTRVAGTAPEEEEEEPEEEEPVPRERDDSDDSGDDSEDSEGSEDSGDDSEEEAPPESVDAGKFCEDLLQDPTKLSEFTRKLYELVNTRGDSKVDLSQIQPFIDYLLNHNFDPDRLRVIINALASREFAQFRDLTYVRFCVFVRYVLQRYAA